MEMELCCVPCVCCTLRMPSQGLAACLEVGFVCWLFVLCMAVLPACVPEKEDIQSPGTGATGNCELPYWCWKLNPGPQALLLATRLSLPALVVLVF